MNNPNYWRPGYEENDSYKNYNECPPFSRDGSIGARWIAPYHVPALRVRVKIKLNGWNDALGTVCGYVVTGKCDSAPEGWLMIWVEPDVRPDWHKKEVPNRMICMFAGIELQPIQE